MFTTEYSIWFLPLCLLIGIGYAAILYWKADKPELPRKVKQIAFVTRSLVVFVLTFLLLNPLYKTVQKEKEIPLLVFGIDNSESLRLNKDSAFYINDFPQQLQKTIDRLKKDYRVDAYLIGDSVKKGTSAGYHDKSTDISAFFETVQAKYSHQNLGALVLCSDGIYNSGQNPLSTAGLISYPVYTVAMGDTTLHKDWLITKVNHNKSVYKNNFFPIEVLVQANKLNGKSGTLRVLHNDEVVFEKQIRILNSEYSEWVRMHFEAKEGGMHRYRIQLSELEGEITYINNESDIFMEVIDEKKKIAIVYNAPHPDVSALVQSMKKQDEYQIETFSVAEFNRPVNEYDILVMHQLPSKTKPVRSLVDAIQKTHIPVLYILGNQTNYAYINALQNGLQVGMSKELFNDAYGIYNQNFTAFSLAVSTQQSLQNFPPVQVPFASYKILPTAQVMIYQKIGNVSTSYPMLFYNQQNENKSATFIGNGLWRWRNYNYLMENNHEAFDELMFKTLQFLSTKEDRSFFRVNGKSVYNENEHVIFDAELFNQNYELINEPEVIMLISDKNKKFTYVFSRSFKSYHLDAGSFAEGDYRWQAKVNYGKETYQKSGYFSVKKINIETLDLTANHQLLKNIADLNHAEMFYPSQWDKLEKHIRDNDNIKTVAHYHKKHHSLLNNLFLFIGIILFLGVEWFLRKWSGSY